MHRLVPILAAAASIIVPDDGAVLRGYSVTDPGNIAVADSVSDFSGVFTAGTETEWCYSVRGAGGEVVENRGWQWRRYIVSGDTQSHTHTESARERSDFDVLLSADGDSVPFIARGRREMAFVFADSGAVINMSAYPALLILSDGDTVTATRLHKQTRRYIRHRKTPIRTQALVTEREWVWRTPGYLAPLAVMEEVTVETAGHAPVSRSRAYLFPRSINEDVNAPPPVPEQHAFSANPAPDIAPARPGAVPMAQPEISYNETTGELAVTASGEFTLSVCDISGRVWIKRRSTLPLVEMLTGLPAGEYVITLEAAGHGAVSKTIRLRG